MLGHSLKLLRADAANLLHHLRRVALIVALQHLEYAAWMLQRVICRVRLYFRTVHMRGTLGMRLRRTRRLVPLFASTFISPRRAFVLTFVFRPAAKQAIQIFGIAI